MNLFTSINPAVFRELIFIIAVFLSPCLASAQNSIPVEFIQEPSRNTTIGTFVLNTTQYASLNDLAAVFKLGAFYNTNTQKYEVRSKEYLIKVTADNPFVILTDKNKYVSIVQLPAITRYAAGSFFVPLETFIPVFANAINEKITYFPDKGLIRVGSKASASAFDITGLQFEPKTNGLLIRVRCTKKLSDYESWLKSVREDTWLYITIADAKADINAINSIAAPLIVKQILTFQSPTSIQLTFKIRGQVNSVELIPAESNNDILISVHTPTEEQIANRKMREIKRNLHQERERWKLDVIVLDAGHGGNDPGALGITKTKEKDITLSVALKLGNMLEKHFPDMKVVYTRKSDEFVELYRRGQIANQNSGKLFISIHCNSMHRKPNPEHGFEIYLLRPGKSESALRIAERENEVVKLEQGYESRYQQLTEENFILLTMAQSAYIKYSEQFAEILQDEMNRLHDVANNGVKQAGFYVLVGASMPNVLVETAYLSNKQDEKILKSSKGQRRIAEAIFNGVKRYKQEYEKSLSEKFDIGSVESVPLNGP